VENVRLLEMDAADIKFSDGSFDIVYAPYLISVVPDPVAVVREMHRVCRPGGKIILLNHFRSSNALLASIERAISPLTVHIGFKSDLDLPAFLAQAALTPISIEKVNVPRIWSLVTCIKD
jgi:phosphatidylethanolamine/phosphatidyl-N-methylethanolamine N-methyltransferase